MQTHWTMIIYIYQINTNTTEPGWGELSEGTGFYPQNNTEVKNVKFMRTTKNSTYTTKPNLCNAG